MIKTETITTVKSEILTNINNRINFEPDLIKKSLHSEEEVVNELQNLIATNILKFDKKTKTYNYQIEPKGEKIILDGNILLPVTIIKRPEKLLICRGFWYEFPPNFDVNRIIWNINLQNTTKSSLVDLLQLTQNKMRKSKIKQVDEYKKLVNLTIPYNEKIKFIINTVGENLTSIVILFTHKLYMEGNFGDYVEHRNFKVNSEIKTSELIEQLKCKIEDRDWLQIKLNNVFNFSDFILAKNEIPYFYDGKTIEYATLSRIRGKFKIDYYSMVNSGIKTKLSTEDFDDVETGLTKIREIFDTYIKSYFESIDIIVN